MPVTDTTTLPPLTEAMTANILSAAGYPRFSAAVRARTDQVAQNKALAIDVAFQMLCDYRARRIQGGDALRGYRNTIHVSVPNQRRYARELAGNAPFSVEG